MGVLEIILLIGSIVGAVSSIGLGVAQNVTNTKNVKDTNAANLEAVRETNAANVEQANLAYQRSLPVNQVRNLMDAGMSRSGALNALTGGGSYTAPVLQSASADAPQKDYSSIISAVERLGNVPANVEQNKIIHEQLNSLKQDQRIKEQNHDLELRERNQRLQLEQERANREQAEELRKVYAHDVEKATDDLRSEIVKVAKQKNVALSSLRSEDDITRLLGDSPVWSAAPASARDNVLQYVRSNSAEKRSNDMYLVERWNKFVQGAQGVVNLKQSVKENIHKLAILADEVTKSGHSVEASDIDLLLKKAGFSDHYQALASMYSAERWINSMRARSAEFHDDSAPTGYLEALKVVDEIMGAITPLKGLLK